VIVDDFDVFSPTFTPNKTDPPLIVDADRMLAATVARKRF
jgi:hypothetical protein